MKFWKLAALPLAVAAAYPGAASAQSNAELLKELKALKDRVGELEKKLADKDAAPADKPQWGMTPEQLQDFNRIAVKAEATEDNLEAAGFKGLKITGFVEPTFIYNQRQHRAGFQFLNNQADGYFYDTSYMGAATIDFTKETDSGSRWKLTLTPNRGVGAALGAGVVQEASLSVPLTDQKTRLIAGLIPDWSGYEYQQPTLNPFTTHNLLYDFTLPVGYVGVGMDVTIDKWWLRGMVANVNSTIRREREKSPSLVMRVDYSKGEFMGFGGAALIGKSPNFNTGDNTMAVLLEADAYFTRGDVTFQGQVSYGQQKKGAITPDVDGSFRDSQWAGASGLFGYSISPRLQGLVRADYIHNTKNGGGLFTYNGYSTVDDATGEITYGNDGRNGIGPDLAGDVNRGANRYALSVGAKYLLNANTTLKAEYRFDGADRPVFLDIKTGEYKKSNQLLGASIVVFF